MQIILSEMKTLYILIFLISANLYSCQSQATNKALSPALFNEKIKATKNHVILDVRTSEEYHAGFIPGAINIDYYNDDFKTDLAKLDRMKTYFLYCETGGRSASAAKFMRKEGFKNIIELDGGLSAWGEAKLPIIKQ